jgi:pilus assembly protein CpaE
MYPLQVLLIGCANQVLPDLRRELSNLSVRIEGEFVDAPACLEYLLANPATDRLFIIQANTAEIEQLERLNESTSGQPILALVDPAKDPSLMLRTMRAGAAQVVRLPLQSDDLRTAVLRIAIQFGHPASKSRVIAVLGAAEGCGATTIALNLASEIGRLRNSLCIVAESAISFGRLAHYLDIAPPVTIGDLLEDFDGLDTERVRRALTKVDEHLRVLVGAYRSITPQQLSPESVSKLIECAKRLAEFIVIDARSVCDSFDFERLSQIQQLVLVTQPTFSSLQNLKLILDALVERRCMAEKFVVMNQYRGESDCTPRGIADALGLPIVYTVDYDFAAVRAAENAGKTLRAVASRSRPLAEITALAKAVLGMTENPQHGLGSILKPIDYLGSLLHLKT